MNSHYEYYKHTPVYTLKELISFCTEKHGERTAFQYQNRKNDIEISFVQFKEDVEALGTALFDKGYRNTHIAVFGENSYEWILVHFAVTCGKNVIVPIDKELDADDIAYLLRDSECKALFYSDTYADIAEELQKNGLDIEFINMKDIPGMIKTGKELIANGKCGYIDQMINKDDLASIVYTSGTTGKPKGVMLTHGNIALNTVATCKNVLIEGPTVLLLPLHHMFGFVAGVTCVLFYGYTVFVNRSLKRIMDDFQIAKPQHLSLVPLVIESFYKRIWLTAEKKNKKKMLEALIRFSDFLLKIKIDMRGVLFKSVLTPFGGRLETVISGGASIDERYVQGFRSFGIQIINGYGITECSPVVATNRNKCPIPGSVGLPLCCNEVKIADDGEILVKGDNVMLGYYHNDAENEKVFVDGWFRTGDLGFLDEYGALHITGRIKNLIILGNGENIPAEAIEEEIYKIPYVKECIAYGKDNMIVAEVYLDDETPDANERIDADIQAVNQRLPQIRNIGKVVVRDTEFPKTTTKKIKRNYGGQDNA